MFFSSMVGLLTHTSNPFLKLISIEMCFSFFSCWLTLESGLLWAFVGPALLVVLVSIMAQNLERTAFYQLLCKI